MKSPSTSLALSLLLALVSITISSSNSAMFDFPSPSGFVKCLKYNSKSVVYTPANSSFTEILEFSARNPRFLFPDSNRLRPAVIVTPTDDSQVPAVLICAKLNGMQIRTRSGGHDFEGLSYTSTYTRPFVLLDMSKLNAVIADPVAKTAVVQAGATLGEVYYWIYKASGRLGFPAGVWSTVGATGLICGGGYGPLRRKYGFAADNVLDARIVDVHGNILDRKTMGEDLFWAIRGGSCSSFGIILSWTLNLVDIPEKVTIFTVSREDRQTEIMYPFQTIAPVLPIEVDIRCHISTKINFNTSTRPDGLVIVLSFTGAYLGSADDLFTIFSTRLPEIGFVREDLVEVSWIEALMQSSFFPLFAAPNKYKAEDFLNRSFLADIPTKAKSDFVRSPLSVPAINGLWDKLLEVGAGDTTVIFTPYGGVLNNYPESTIPFPNRAGTLFMIYARVLWVGNTTQKLEWIRSLHDYLTPYVSSNPRRAYYNYDDLDLGANPATGIISNADARKWGSSYFNENFNRLIKIKTRVDPFNFFRQEQTVPPFSLIQDM
ncbi:THCA synthase [Heracleum sosnowskyi]|uniref:THCA synthase n=1 Tax=Heracleum sosnowskyi TaxID=360622 RepID=A0AAD8J6X7_9APIA|nr:THCA synthase [Heracleum sosnowskyi]